jgi:hypothetical protein
LRLGLGTIIIGVAIFCAVMLRRSEIRSRAYAYQRHVLARREAERDRNNL